MLNSTIQKLLTLLLLASMVQMAAGFDLRFLNNSPVRYFREADWKMASDAVRKALNETKDGETVSWENPQSKFSGTVSPLTTETQNDTTCRKIRIENNAKGMSGGGTYRFCQKPDGKWAAQQGTPKAADETKASSQQAE